MAAGYSCTPAMSALAALPVLRYFLQAAAALALALASLALAVSFFLQRRLSQHLLLLL
jgi:hypothetical protein